MNLGTSRILALAAAIVLSAAMGRNCEAGQPQAAERTASASSCCAIASELAASATRIAVHAHRWLDSLRTAVTATVNGGNTAPRGRYNGVLWDDHRLLEEISRIG